MRINTNPKDKHFPLSLHPPTPMKMPLPHSRKRLGLLIIVLPIIASLAALLLLVVSGLLRVAVLGDPAAAGYTDSAILNGVDAILNILVLIFVSFIISLAIPGIVLLCTKEPQPLVLNHGITLAGRGRRLAASFLNVFVTFIPIIIFAVSVSLDNRGDDTFPHSLIIGLVCILLILSLYAVQVYYLITQGQSLGKKWLKIRIVDAKTYKVGGFCKNVLLRTVCNGLLSIIPWYSYIDIFYMFGKDRRCVHDHLAGTIVVNVMTIEDTETSTYRPFRPPMPKKAWTTGQVIRTVIAVIAALFFSSFVVGLGAINFLNKIAVDTNNRSLSAFESGNSDQAISQLQIASKYAVKNDTKINTLKNLAYAYSSESKNELALSTFKEALALTSNGSFDYYLISGEVALLEGKPNEAQLAYNKAYEINPNEFQINNALAMFYLDFESVAPQYIDYKKALIYAQKAYDLNKLESFKQNLAIAYYYNENYTQTISLLSTSNFTNHPYAALWLGLAYAQKDDTVNAKFYFQKGFTGGAIVP